MRSKLTLTIVVTVVLVYSVILGLKGIALVQSGSAVGILLGTAVLIVPLLGVILLRKELEFGKHCAALADRLADEGDLPVDDLPRRPSGRVDRDAADAQFAEMRQVVEADPESWRAWFKLALAYDAAGDRGRAREAARHAISLSVAERSA